MAKPKATRQRNRVASKVTALTRRIDAVQLQKLRARLAHIDRHFVRSASDEATPCVVYQMASEYLARFYIPQRDLVELNGSADRQPLAAFYTNNLCEVSAVPAGALLRNWADIPGRDRSPPRATDGPMVTMSLPDEAGSANAADEIAMSVESQEVAQILANSCANISATDEPTEPLAATPHDSSVNESERETRIVDRSGSPDMFASDSDGDCEPPRSPATTTKEAPSPALSSDPAKCSLDPESTESETAPNEEDQLIDLYDRVAGIRRLPHTPVVQVASQSSSSSSDCLPVAPVFDSLELFYSGDSEQERSLRMVVSSTDPAGESSLSYVSYAGDEIVDAIGASDCDQPQLVVAFSSSSEDYQDAVQDIKNEPSISIMCSQECDDELIVGQPLVVVDADDGARHDVAFDEPIMMVIDRFEVSDEGKIFDCIYLLPNN